MQNESLNAGYLDVTDDDLRMMSPSGIFQMAASLGSKGRRARSVESRLALAVQELTSLEEGTEASLRAAAKILDDAKRRHLHEESGFDGWNELRRRLIGSQTLLEALLGIDDLGDIPPPPSSGTLPSSRDDGKKKRSQRSRALVRLSGAMLKMRNIEEDLRRRTAASRAVLEHIESSRLHEECGYNSFEEFLACVLAPCPTLAVSMATAEDRCTPSTALRGVANDVQCAAERSSQRVRSAPPPLPVAVPSSPPQVVQASLPSAALPAPAPSELPASVFPKRQAATEWPRVPLPLVFAAGIAIALLLAWPPDVTLFGP